MGFQHSSWDLTLVDERSDYQTHQSVSLVLVNAQLSLLEMETASFLHCLEKKELDTYTHTARRHSFLLGRLASKKALNAFAQSGNPLNMFHVSNGCMGQPYFQDMSYHLSISHSGCYGAAMVGESGLAFGIDIESVENKFHVPDDIFEPSELSLEFPKSWEEAESKLALWSAKEALVKFLQIGFTTSMTMIEVSEVSSQTDRLIKIKFKHFHSVIGWILKRDDYFLAICLPSQLALKSTL